MNLILKYLSEFKFKNSSVKLGFSIASGIFGYGLISPHYGTIVVGENNRIGNYAVLHTSTCITARAKSNGNALLAGAPASRKKTIPAWFDYQGNIETIKSVKAVEELKLSMGLLDKEIKAIFDKSNADA